MQKRLIMLRGLQGSGKSFWCREFMNKPENKGQYKHVTKDALREMLDYSRWSSGNEKFVLALRDHIVIETLKDNKSVLVDDTNLHPKHETCLREIASQLGAEFNIVSFMDVPIETCIEQDLKRPNSVGERVICKSYQQYLEWNHLLPEKPFYDPLLPDVILCDMDGTLSLIPEGKNAYDRDFENDILNEPVANILRRFSENEDIILVSGREEKFRGQTVEFLNKYDVEFYRLYMRPTGDKRKDSIIKQEFYEQYIKGKYNILFVLDDRNQTVGMWRQNGLQCFQVAEGDF
jgi:predicted kinase